MKRFNNPYEFQEYQKKLIAKYKHLLKLIKLEDITSNLGCEFDVNNQYAAWVNDYLGATPCEKANELYEQLIESDELQVVIKDIDNIFKTIYVVVPEKLEDEDEIIQLFDNSNKQSNEITVDNILDKNLNIIATFKPNIFKDELTSDDTFCINTFLNTQAQLSTKEKEEKIDPLHYEETKRQIKKDIEDVKNDKITIAEMLNHYGYTFEDFDNDKVKNLIDQIVNNTITQDELLNKVSNGEVSPMEVEIIDTQLKLAYPNIYKKLNNL